MAKTSRATSQSKKSGEQGRFDRSEAMEIAREVYEKAQEILDSDERVLDHEASDIATNVEMCVMDGLMELKR